MGFYSQEQLESLNFKYLGKNVKISDKASFYNSANISIDDNSRIDDFSVLSAGEGGILIGKNVHIAVFCSLIGEAKITLDDYSGISSRVSIYSSNDDYSGEYLTNPTINKKFTNVSSKPVFLEKHVIVGSGTVILPGVVIAEGGAIAGLSLVNKNCERFSVYGGVPAKKLKNRSNELLKYEEEHAKEIKRQ